MNEQPIVLKQRRDLGEIIETAVNLYFQNFAALFVIASVVIPLGVAGAVLEQAIDEPGPGALILVAPFTLLQFAANLLAAAALIAALTDIEAGRPAEFSRAYDAAFARFWTLAAAVLRAAAVILPALALVFALSVLASTAEPDSNDAALLFVLVLVLPLVFVVSLPWVVYFAIRWLFIEQAVMLDGTSAKAALSYSADAVQGRWWRTFGIALLIVIIVGVPANVVAGLFSLAPVLVSGTVNAVVNAAVLPFAVTAMTLLYTDLKTRREADLAVSPA